MGDSKNTTVVQTELGAVTVRRMALRDYAELLRALDTLPNALKKFVNGRSPEQLKGMQASDLVTALPEILADSWEDWVAVLAVPTDKDKDYLLSLDAADALEIIDAVLELNDIVRIANAVKKMQARMAKIQTSQLPTKQK